MKRTAYLLNLFRGFLLNVKDEWKNSFDPFLNYFVVVRIGLDEFSQGYRYLRREIKFELS